MEKCCSVCGECKPEADFYTREARCKECTKAAVRKRYHEKFATIQEYERNRAKTPHRKAKCLEYQKTRRRLHRNKDIARATVNRNKRLGKLSPQPCEVCGAPAQGHHDDYSKPLEVRWLCFEHHRKIGHGQLQHLEQQ